MTLHISDEVILGVTHLLVDGKLVRLLKCPFCSFKNIHEDTITHHIRYNADGKHTVDLDKLDKKIFFVTYRKQSHYGSYMSKRHLPIPWIRCFWCSYKDKQVCDLQRHILENHRYQVSRIEITNSERRRIAERDPFYFMYEAIEFKLDKAAMNCKREFVEEYNSNGV